MSCWDTSILFSTLAIALTTACFSEENIDRSESRRFRLDYGATIDELPAGARVRVWVPVPQNSEYQNIEVLQADLPVAGRITVERTHGNRMLYFETKGAASGTLTFSTAYNVDRKEVRGLAGESEQRRLNDEQRALFLSANRNIPLQGKQLALLDGLDLSGEPLSLARVLYDRVDDHVQYDKSKPGYGNGDVAWVCDSRTGNCTDFHSLFIALSRAQGLPARFEIGFPLPPARGSGTIGGYHCWALFHVDGKGWVPVDISEADKHPELKQYYFGNLTENRVTFTSGRDIELVPIQDGDPLNYFIYPYVEVDGTPWDKLTTRFRFEDN